GSRRARAGLWEGDGQGRGGKGAARRWTASRLPAAGGVRPIGRINGRHSRRHVILAAPTNAGKSLVGLLALLDGVRQGGRALLVAPLRAIAREKADELAAVAPGLADVLGRPVTVRISTGDYRLRHRVLG